MPRENRRQQENPGATESSPGLCCKQLQRMLILLVKGFGQGVMEVCEHGCSLYTLEKHFAENIVHGCVSLQKSLEGSDLFRLRRWKCRLCQLGSVT